ncbi:MAG: diversity-generating retroelement protein Avd [Candidatus Magnetomorum sp.]|nr:diversity-generating retroelement protein Avd [Candidatus Magnetomorum sp.]
MNKNLNEDLPIFVKWVDFTKWLLPVTAKFPQRTRFTFANRLDNFALDMVEDLVEARYTKKRKNILQKANLRLEKMRILIRLCKDMNLISYKSYEFAIKAMNEIGQMLGGWIKSSGDWQ